jgi:hypothetical protein
MTNEVFADGIARIRVVNGTIRMEFVSSVEGADGATKLEPRTRVVMPVKGFVDAYNTMQRAMAALIADGTVRSARERAAEKQGKSRPTGPRFAMKPSGRKGAGG